MDKIGTSGKDRHIEIVNLFKVDLSEFDCMLIYHKTSLTQWGRKGGISCITFEFWHKLFGKFCIKDWLLLSCTLSHIIYKFIHVLNIILIDNSIFFISVYKTLHSVCNRSCRHIHCVHNNWSNQTLCWISRELGRKGE